MANFCPKWLKTEVFAFFVKSLDHWYIILTFQLCSMVEWVHLTRWAPPSGIKFWRNQEAEERIWIQNCLSKKKCFSINSHERQDTLHGHVIRSRGFFIFLAHKIIVSKRNFDTPIPSPLKKKKCIRVFVRAPHF